MSKAYHYIVFLLVLFSQNFGQSQSLVASTGQSLSNSSYSVDYSIGEMAVNFISSGNSVFTIGFLQPVFQIKEEKPVVIIPSIQPKDNTLVVYQFMSPNDDGKNDTFYVNSLENFPENEVIIMDRTGKIVYQQKNYANNWSGEGLPEDNYFYVVKIPSANTELKGGLVLAR